MPTRVRLVTLVLVAVLAFAGCGSSAGSPVVTPDAQLRFGVDMAERGLWSEAFFRFQQAQRLQGDTPKVLNNLAVASEAMGQFDQALEYYKQALRLAPGDADLKGNYDRFVSFYESFRARGDGEGAEPAAAADPAPSATPAPGPALPGPIAIPGAEPPGSGPNSGPPEVPPLIPEPVPTPPLATALPAPHTPGVADHA